MAPLLDERTRQLWAAAESVAIGYGGDALVSAAAGVARQTIANGRRELAAGVAVTTPIRRVGGRAPAHRRDPTRRRGRVGSARGATDARGSDLAAALDVQESREVDGPWPRPTGR